MQIKYICTFFGTPSKSLSITSSTCRAILLMATEGALHHPLHWLYCSTGGDHGFGQVAGIRFSIKRSVYLSTVNVKK